MPRLRDIRDETFALLLAEGVAAPLAFEQAYRAAAGFGWHRRPSDPIEAWEADELARRPDIANRIIEFISERQRQQPSMALHRPEALMSRETMARVLQDHAGALTLAFDPAEQRRLAAQGRALVHAARVAGYMQAAPGAPHTLDHLTEQELLDIINGEADPLCGIRSPDMWKASKEREAISGSRAEIHAKKRSAKRPRLTPQ